MGPVGARASCRTTLRHVDALVSTSPGAPRTSRLSILTALMRMCRSRRCPIGFPSPLSTVAFQVRRSNLARQSLIPCLNDHSGISRILTKGHSLALDVVHTLRDRLKVPTRILLRRPDAGLPRAPRSVS